MKELKKEKSRIALCLSGQLRTFKECFSYLEENIIKCNPQFDFDLIGYFNSSEKLPWISTYGFKSLEIFDFNNIKVPNLTYQDNKYTINYPPRAKATFYQLFGIQKVNKLRKRYELENNFQYDYLIRIRPDFKFLSEVDLTSLDKDKIYIPIEQDHFGYNDRFAIGDRDLMEIYMDRFNFYLQQHPEILNYTTHIETNLKIWLEINNISIERLPFSYCMSRDNGDIDLVLV